ncbi:hypothetical protein M1555_04190 [Patescibacteria group bacterium]|nr:hypothetical protein [Patescibacteria group bacterium]
MDHNSLFHHVRVLAQGSSDSLGTIGGGGLGPFAAKNYSGGGTQALVDITKAVSAIIGFLTIAAGIWFLFQLLIGAISWITSGGDKTNLENARNRIIHGLIGLIIVVMGWAILAIVGQFLGYDILLSNPGSIINQIRL